MQEIEKITLICFCLYHNKIGSFEELRKLRFEERNSSKGHVCVTPTLEKMICFFMVQCGTFLCGMSKQKKAIFLQSTENHFPFGGWGVGTTYLRNLRHGSPKLHIHAPKKINIYWLPKIRQSKSLQLYSWFTKSRQISIDLFFNRLDVHMAMGRSGTRGTARPPPNYNKAH